MDRSNRVTLLEPILLILKQRTGVASVLGVIVSVVMLLKGFTPQEIGIVLAPIFTYVAKQTVLDSKEASDRLVSEVQDVLDAIELVDKEDEGLG